MWVSFEGWPAPRRNEGQNKRRHRVADNEERKIMKTTILLAIAAATGLSFAAGVNAGDLFTSTKGAQLQYDLRKVPGTTPEVPDRSVKAGSPKALDFANSVRKVEGLRRTGFDGAIRHLGRCPRDLTQVVLELGAFSRGKQVTRVNTGGKAQAGRGCDCQ